MKKVVIFVLLLCVMLTSLLPSALAAESNCPVRLPGYFAPYGVETPIDCSGPAPKTADGMPLASLSVLLIASGASLLMLKKH